ncbi:hypothetical protein Tco_0926661 [Tanacetum coccineum]|uniref:Reverse transcriptase domain-containing protein n=1 Tax=Tanacetum coccineum TaxID=301880 RepID=A0ABQ5DD30_9ASTR
MRDFHKTHLSGSGTATKPTPSAIIKPSVTNEGTGVKPGFLDVTKEESSKSEDESWGNDDDDNNNDQDSGSEGSDQQKDKEDDEKIEDDEEEEEEEIVKTLSNDSDDEDETKIADKAEGDEDEEMDYTTSLLYNDVDIRMHEPVDADKGFVQEKGTDAAMTNIQQGNENPKIVQVIEDAHVTLSTVPQKTEVLVTSSSHLSDLAAKFLNFSDIPHTDAKIVSLMDVYVHHEVPSQQTPTLLTIPVSVISDSSPVFSTMVQESLDNAVLAKESSQPQSSYEAATTLTKFKLKKIHIDKIDKSESYLAALKHRECYEGLIKSYDINKSLFSTYGKVYSLKRSQKDKDKDIDPSVRSDRGKSVQSEVPEFEVADSDMPQDQEENLGNDDVELKEKVASKRDWFTKPTQPQEPTDPDWNVDKTPQQGQNQSWLMTLASSADKPSKTFDELMSTPIDFSAFIMNGLKINNLTQETLLGPAFRLLKGTRSNYAELEYDFEECYKALSEKLDWENPEGGDYPFDLTKPLPLVMSRNRQKVSVKVAYDKHALWGISHWREQRKSFYGADNILYRFKEGDFPHLRVNEIEDMLLLVIQNRLTNLSGDEILYFAIALRMFTRNLVIQKLRTSLDDITKNIQMEYMPKRRWSRLKKKRANIMFKAIDKQLKERWLMRSLKNQNQRDLPRDIPLDSIVVLRYEKRSKSKNKGKVPTEMELVLEQTQQGTSYEVSMEILLEPTSNKLMVGDLCDSIRIKLVKTGKKQWSILTDSKELIKMDVERRSVKVKEIQDKRILKAFKLSYQEKYEHVGPKSQDHKMARLQDDVKEVMIG